MNPFVQLHLLVLLLTATAILGKLVSLGAGPLVSWRTALAALGAFAWVALVRRRALWLGMRKCVTLMAVGAIIGLHWLAFFGSIKVSNVSICLAGLASISIFTAFTEPLINRRQIRPFEVLTGLLVLGGIVLIAGVERANLPGLGLAVLSAFLAAIFPVLNRTLVTRGGDPMTMVGWEMVGACLVCLLLTPVFEPDGLAALFVLERLDWVWTLALAWLCTVFAHALHIRLLKALSAFTVNLAFNFEPVYGILAAALIFREHQQLHPAFYAGACAILAANILHAWIEKRRRKIAVIG